MPASTQSLLLARDRTALLLEAAQLLLDELALLAEQRWEDLPAVKKRKAVAASRLRRFRAEAEAADGAPSHHALESLLADLETQTRGKIRARLDLIGHQLLALQELSLYLNESLHVTLQASPKRPLGNGGAVG